MVCSVYFQVREELNHVMRTAKTARKHALRMLEMVGMDAMSQRERDDQEAQLKRHMEQVLMPLSSSLPESLLFRFLYSGSFAGVLLGTPTQNSTGDQQ
jgi:hypothetical protein